MSPIDDGSLRDQLQRRATADVLAPEESEQIVGAARRHGHDRHGRMPWRGRLNGWLAAGAAAIGILLIVVSVLRGPMPPPPAAPSGSALGQDMPASPPVTSVGPTEQPIAGPDVFSAQELSDMIGGERIGDVVLAHARISHMRIRQICDPPEPCHAYFLPDVSGPNVVVVGWRTAREGEGTHYADDGVVRWLTLINLPAELGLSAFKILGDAVEYLGPVVETQDRDVVWSVRGIQTGEHAEPSDDLYIVEGWLVQTPMISCPAPADYGPGTDTAYSCGGSFVTQNRILTHTSEHGDLLDPGGLRVQWDAYDDFAASPDQGGLRGVEPRLGTYLVRSAGCAHLVMGDCPVWSMVGRLDPLLAATPSPPPTEPPPTLPPRADAILTADQIAELALNPGPTGRVLIARASVELSAPQPADVRCVDPLCTIGLLDASATTVPVFVAGGSPSPNSSEIQAFRLLGDALEYIGPVAVLAGTTELAWTVSDIRSGGPLITGEFLYPVEGWLVEPINDHECPESPDAGPDADYSYWCASSWLSEDRVYMDPRDTNPQEVVAGALQVQRPAYQHFALHPDPEGPRGAEPRHDTYLVREASCPEVRMGACPVWEMVATLDAEAAPDYAARADCFSYFTIADSAQVSSQQLAQGADAIVIGTLASLGPGFWDSPDGRRPRSYRSISDARLLTALDIAVDGTLKGTVGGAVRHGGSYGCDTGNNSPEVQLWEGGRFVFFMIDVTWSRPGSNPSLVTEAWPVGADGRVHDPRTEDVWLTVDELGPYLFGPEPTPMSAPSPGEPGDGPLG